jgi:hypothetical protein
MPPKAYLGIKDPLPAGSCGNFSGALSKRFPGSLTPFARR